MDTTEEHHGGVLEDTVPTGGRLGIFRPFTAATCLGPAASHQPPTPVAGSGVLTDIDSADGWTADRCDERFVGYLVQLKPDL